MSLAAAVDVSPMTRGSTAVAPRVLVVSNRDDIAWVLGPLADADLGGATVKRTSLLPGLDVLPDLVVVDGRDPVLAAAWRAWLTGPGGGAAALLLGGEPLADAPYVVVVPLEASPGRLAAAIATAVERGRAHAASAQLGQRLIRCERRLTAFLEHSPDAFGMLDRHGRIVFVAPSAEQVQGYPAAELLGKDLFALLHPYDEAGARARFAALLSAPRAVSRMTVRRRHPRGHYQWVEITAANLLDEPAVAAVIASCHNVDERETALAALRAAELRAQQLARHLPIVTWLQRVDDRAFEQVSPAFEALWGRPVDAVLADPAVWRDAVHPDDQVQLDALDRAADRAITVEYRVVRPDGSIVRVEAHQRPIVDERGQVVRIAGVARDVTETRRIDDEVDAARRITALTSLAGSLAHDLNNVVAGLQIQCDLLLESELSPEARDDITCLLELGQRGTAIARRLLEVTRRFPTAARPIDLGDLVRRALPVLARVLGPTIAIDVEVGKTLPLVTGDARLLEHALVQLALNARDALPGGGRVRVSATIADGRVALAFADDGPGMLDDVCRLATAPFFTTRRERVGLGLASVAQIVKQHQGNLRLDSAPGAGTTVTIALPATA